MSHWQYENLASLKHLGSRVPSGDNMANKTIIRTFPWL